MNYKEYCIDSLASIRDAMKKLGELKPQILIVMDKSKLVGTLTDGDVRRFLLAGGKIEEPVLEAANKTPKMATNKQKAKELYSEKEYTAIPIINNNDEIIDLYIGSFYYERKYSKLGIPVVINAGGKGTRLEPFTKILPKPLIPVGEHPIIEQIMQEYLKFGCERFHIIVNYKKQLIKAYFSETEKKYAVSWYDETKPLGTGGGLSLLKGKIQSTFFFTNCDTLLQSNYESMLRFHRENKNHITMICAHKNLVIPYGVVEMGESGVIENMKEKPEINFLTNTGMYIVEPEVLETIEDNVSIGFPDIVERQRMAGKRVAVYPVSENEWMDMGQLAELEKMRERLYGE